MEALSRSWLDIGGVMYLYALEGTSKIYLSQVKIQLLTNMGVQLSNDVEKRHFAKSLLQIGEGTHPTNCVTGQMELMNDIIVGSSDALMYKVFRTLL
ncbi:hypothetical protein CEXT_441361 [Caerostris extrusa]|uniref:Uncharacterized protein n=1 Tax=Caerostris extrusa TaxID=172846 RepID=A0AAV4UM98_CAEEX|nr:hypothetical protein CEXT_441361 [Caerostris extrusa]